jgi:hypothetical protein
MGIFRVVRTDNGYCYKGAELAPGTAQLFVARVAVGRAERRRKEDSRCAACFECNVLGYLQW